MNFRRAALLAGILGIWFLPGCGSAYLATYTLPPIGPQPTSILFVITPPGSLAINASIPLNAAVTNNSSSALINWTVTCGSAGACGTFAPTQTASGGNTTYTAPGTIPAGAKVTVTATLLGDSTKTATASITITPPQPIAVTFAGVPPASLQVGAAAAIAADITNDTSANPQVSWSVTCGSGACGSFSPTRTFSEAPTSFTAPTTIPSGNVVTVTATSVTDSTKSASTNITITAAAPNLANGTYVFHLAGPVGSGTNFIAGTIVAQGGVITAGEQDYVNYALNQSDQQNIYGFDQNMQGSYLVTPDGNLEITLNTGDANAGVGGTEVINGVVVSASRALITEVNGAIGTGTLDLQTATAAPTGAYAFAVSGVDASGEPAGIGGVLSIGSGGTITPAASVIDVNDNSVFTGALTPGVSSVSTAADKFGRIEFQLTFTVGTSSESLSLAGYVVDGNHIRLVETSGDNFQGVLGGTALSQSAGAATSLAGLTYVFGASGEDASGGLQVAGVMVADGVGGLTGTLNWNDLTAKTTQAPIAFTGAYTVDPTGRATLSNVTDGVTFNYQFEFYLTGNGEGLLLSSSPTSTTSQMITGRGLQQTTTPTFSGTYAMNAEPSGALGPITSVAGATSYSLSGFVDFGNGPANSAILGTVNQVATGILTGTITGLDSSSYTSANSFAVYLVDPTQGFLIETDNTQLTLGYLELQ